MTGNDGKVASLELKRSESAPDVRYAKGWIRECLDEGGFRAVCLIAIRGDGSTKGFRSDIDNEDLQVLNAMIANLDRVKGEYVAELRSRTMQTGMPKDDEEDDT